MRGLLADTRWDAKNGSHEGRQRGRWILRGGDYDIPHRLLWRCGYAYMYTYTLNDNNVF